MVAGPALSALRIGSNGPDTLTGTSGNDQLTGKGDADVLKGLTGNDTYYFADNFSRFADGTGGADTLVEPATVVVAGTKVPGGVDTVNFRNVSAGGVSIYLQREWAQQGYNVATGPNGNRVVFNYTNAGTVVQSVVEKAIGGQGNGDWIEGGGASNTLMPGGGATDNLLDKGGWNDGPAGLPELVASNDVFKGFADNTGTDQVEDWGGTGDILDLRPFSTDDVYIDAINQDGTVASEESLQIVTGPSSQVIILGQFGDFNGWTGQFGMHGRIEKIIFADTTITDTTTLSQVSTASGMPVSAQALSPKQAALAEAAPLLAKEARTLADPSEPPGANKAIRGEVGVGAEIGPESGKDTKAKQDTGKQAKKDKHEQKAKHGKRQGQPR